MRTIEIEDEDLTTKPKRPKLSELEEIRQRRALNGINASSKPLAASSWNGGAKSDFHEIDLISLSSDEETTRKKASPKGNGVNGSLLSRMEENASKKKVSAALEDDEEIFALSSDEEKKKSPKSSSKQGKRLRRLVKSTENDSDDPFVFDLDGEDDEEAQKSKRSPKIETKNLKKETKNPKIERGEKSKAKSKRWASSGEDFGEEDYLDEDDMDKMARFEKMIQKAEKIAKQVGDRLKDATDTDQITTLSEGAIAFAKPIKHIIDQSPTITRKLKDYQVTALNWLRLLHLQGCNGILADDMGLGKTIQTISLLCWVHDMAELYASKTLAGETKNGVENKKNGGESNDQSIEIEDENNQSDTDFNKILDISRLSDPSMDYMSFSDSSNSYPSLIVSPASTIANWEREFSIWAPHLRVLVFHGNFNEREEIKDDIRHHWKRYKQHSFDVMITTYHTVGAKSDANFFKHGIRFNYLIVDEAQMLKGKKTARFNHLMQIRALHRLMLTGTPLQNNLDELQALLAFLMPNLFGLLIGFSMSRELAEHRGAGEKVHEHEYVAKLKELLTPFMMRRLKSQVGLGLLPKIHTIINVPATEIQARVNARIFGKTKITIDSASRPSKESYGNQSDVVLIKDDHTTTNTTPTTMSPTTNDDRSDFSNDFELRPPSKSNPARTVIPDLPSTLKSQSSAIENQSDESEPALANGLMQLRQVANHPIFVRAFYSSEQIIEIASVLLRTKHKKFKNYTLDEIVNDLELTSDWDLHHLALEYPASLKHLTLSEAQLFESSGKLIVLETLLPKLKREGHRIVLFSQFTTVLDLLELFLQRRAKMGYLRLDGSTVVSERQNLMDLFNSEVDTYTVFLASTLAGGLGVNLTSADTVIFYDISFNPHVDRQAEDRCYRLGQEKEVTIYNLLVPGTIEVHMHKMANAKTELNDIMLNEGSFAEKEAARLAKENDNEGSSSPDSPLQDTDANSSNSGRKVASKSKKSAKKEICVDSDEEDTEEKQKSLSRKSTAEMVFMKQVARSLSNEG